MPELPPPKARLHPKESAECNAPACLRALPFHQYAELHVTSNFTFLTGASHPDELVIRAAELGYTAIGIADKNSLAGIVRAHVAAKEVGIPLAVGCRLELIGPTNGTTNGHGCTQIDLNHSNSFRVHPCPSVVSHLSILTYPTDKSSYARLCRLLTLGKRRAPKGECHLTIHDLLDYHPGLLAVVVPPAILDQDFIDVLVGLKSHFTADRLSIAISRLYGADDGMRMKQIAALAAHVGLPLAATNDVHYHIPSRRPLQDVLACIRHGCRIEQAGYRLFPNAERYLKPPEEMARLFAEYPHAIARSVEIAKRASAFSLDELRYQYPDEIVPYGCTPMQHLHHLTWHGAAERYPQGISSKVKAQIEHEFKLIDELNYAPYFLTVHDIVREARVRKILCQGRGAAANSAVCYCLGVTAVDPERIDVLFERFISKERNEPPDIDVDFEHERREEIIQYIYKKYGRDRAGLTAEVITYRGRSAVRDVGKAMGLSLDCVDRLAKNIEWWSSDLSDTSMRELGLNPHDPTIQRVLGLTNEILGFPRHLSQHVGGFVITRGPLSELVPIENAAMEDRTVIEWDKDDIDAMGMLKIDVLGLGMLTCIRKGFEFVNEMDAQRHRGTEARRHEEEGDRHQGDNLIGCKQPQRSIDNDTDSNVSRFDCMAKGNGVGEDDLSSNGGNAGVRAVWTDEPNASCSSIGSIEHGGGICAAEHSRLCEAPAHREGIAGGIVNPVRIDHRSGNAQVQLSDHGFALGNGSCVAGIDQKSREKDQEVNGNRHEGIEARRHEGEVNAPSARIIAHRSLVAAALWDPQNTHPTLCPRASVPSCPSGAYPPPCLRAFVPSCLPTFPLQLHTVPPEDSAVYDMICVADTVGVFQIESRAQMSMLPRLRPRCFYDLVIEVAIVRPGPIQGDMVHPYLRRRNGEEAITYPDDRVKKVLGKTLGVPLFQEQAMSLAIVAAGFTPGEADQLRRAIAAWKTKGNKIAQFGERLMSGMIANGYEPQFAQRCFEQVKGFSGYGFPESHAASFALLVYVSAWLKCHYPAAFAAALLNSQPMGFYAPAQIVRDAQEHGVTALPIDVNHSEWDCTLEHDAFSPEACPVLRLGMRLIRGLSEIDANAVVAARNKFGPFQSIDALHRASGVRVSVLRRLAAADSFGSMGLDRQHALWQVRALKDERLPIFEETSKRLNVQTSKSSASHCLDVCLPAVSDFRKVAHDCAATGLSLRAHPISFIRKKLDSMRATPNVELKDQARWAHGKDIAVAGLVLVRQRPSTANGIIFMTLEDETGIANLIIRPNVYKAHRRAARHGIVVLARGRVERQGEVVHVLVRELCEITTDEAPLQSHSRDFH